MITVNGKEVTLTGPLSVADYLEQNNYQIKRIAVEMNGDILPKYSYSDTMLKDGGPSGGCKFCRRRLRNHVSYTYKKKKSTPPLTSDIHRRRRSFSRQEM